MNLAAETSQQKKDNIGKALGRVASGVYIVTIGDEKHRDGMLATWIGQAAFEPPMVNVVVKQERAILNKLGLGAHLVVNVLGKNNMDIFKNFAKPHADGLNRFDQLKVENKSFGPVLTDAIAYMGCTVAHQVVAGDHMVIVARVDEGAVLKTDDEPMVHLRSNGFQY